MTGKEMQWKRLATRGKTFGLSLSGNASEMAEADAFTPQS
jgi:hypothetical protein